MFAGRVGGAVMGGLRARTTISGTLSISDRVSESCAKMKVVCHYGPLSITRSRTSLSRVLNDYNLIYHSTSFERQIYVTRRVNNVRNRRKRLLNCTRPPALAYEPDELLKTFVNVVNITGNDF